MGLNRITAESIEAAAEGCEETAIREIVSRLSPPRRLILSKLTKDNSDIGIDTKTLHTYVERVIAARVRYSDWAVYKDLKELKDLGLICKMPRGGRWGKRVYGDWWAINPALRELFARIASES